MPCASHNHIGHLMAVRMSGFGVWSNLDGVYVLDLEVGEEKIFRRGNAKIHFDKSLSMWVISDGDMIVGRQGLDNIRNGYRSRPEGEWEENKKVTEAKDSVSIVSMLAFPAPSLDLDFYENNGVSQWPLLKQPDLIMLEVKGGSNGKVERVPAIFHRYRGAKFTVLYSHGNGEDVGLLVDEMKSMATTMKANVFVYDYVGYSTSKLEGSAASESGCYRAITAAWDFLTQDMTIPPRNIVLYGRSIGSGPTIDLASRPYCRDSIGGVILQCPILSGGCVLLGPTAGVMGRPFDIFTNYTKIGRIRKPVAVMHGTVDEVVPLVNGQRLHALCRQPYQAFWVDGHGHNDMPPDLCDEYAAGFIASLDSPPLADDPDLDELFKKCKAAATSSALTDNDSGSTKSAECLVS